MSIPPVNSVEAFVTPDGRLSLEGQQMLQEIAAATARRDFVVTPQHFASEAQMAVDADAAMVAAVNAAVSSPGGKLVLPKGLYLISTGLNLLRDGLVIEGEGRHFSQIVAKTQGGDILSRQWNTGSANAYLQDVVLRDFAIVMRHPATAAPSNYRQVALNCRHVTRSQFERLYIGNYPRGLSADTYGQPSSQPNARQGIGVSAGTTSAGDAAYSGGEVNTHRDIMVAGAAKGFALDDPEFYNPGYSSAAYTHIFDHCEAQIVEMGFGQLSQYGAGHTFRDCIVQSVGRATGSSATTYEFRIDGYDNTIIGGYGEAAAADHEFYFGSSSRRNRVYHRLNSGSTVPTDLGADNLIERINRTTGRHELFYNGKDMNRGRAQAFVTWSVSGGVVTILDSWGISNLVRNGTGDFTIFFQTDTFANANYAYALSGSVNTSGHSGVVYPFDGDDILQTQIRVLSLNINVGAQQDFMKYSAIFFAGQ